MIVFGIIDQIAKKPIVVFSASNIADADRFVKNNFVKATREALEGLELVQLSDDISDEYFDAWLALYRSESLISVFERYRFGFAAVPDPKPSV